MSTELTFNGGCLDASVNQTEYTINYVPFLVLTGVSSSLSLLGSVFIFLSYYRNNERSFNFRLLVFLTIADFFNAFGNLLGVIRYSVVDPVITNDNTCDSDNLCVSQSFITVFSSLASFWWTVFIALNHFLHQRESRCLEKPPIQVFCHLCGWICPVTIAIVSLHYDVLGEGLSASSGPWCWIKDCNLTSASSSVWMAITGKGWEITTYCVTFAFYMLLKFQKCRSHNMQKKELLVRKSSSILSYQSISPEDTNRYSINQETQEEEEFGLLWVFLYMYLTRLWGTVRYFIFVGHNGSTYISFFDKADDGLMYLQSIGDSAQAFVNFLGFVVWPKLKRKKRDNSDSTTIML
ncbi:G-protein coupled receptor 157-like [Saccostrea echinata]|uniref:G-protein coupled receptor 157-like n=1 Tax=Saccostrea echinata TaxID=191078 RepID=UPI002A80A8A9|nr:G-protein coupled receptor 157-like [Saccostrea echinata]